MRNLFQLVLQMSLTGGYVILILCLARFPLKKAPGWISRLIWAAALFRLLCPLTFRAQVSLIPAAVAEPSVSGEGTLFLGMTSGTASGTVSGAVPAAPGWADVCGWVWLAGLLLMAGYTLLSAVRTRRRLRFVRRCPDGAFEGEGLPTAFVFGVLRPRICLPAGLDPVGRRYILLHEQTHVRQLDPLYKLLLWAAVCVHWFNPLCWLMFCLAGDDIERACDERTLRGAEPSVRAAYSAALLHFASGRRVWNGSPVLFAESHTKGRIMSVLNYKKPAFWVVIAAVLLAAVLCICLLVNPKSAQDASSQPSSPASAGQEVSAGPNGEAGGSSDSSGQSVTGTGGADDPSSVETAYTEASYLAEVLRLLTTNGSSVSFTLPKGVPDGLHTDVRVTAHVPDGEGSTAVFEGFPEQNMFTPGVRYTADFSGRLGDGSSVGMTVWLVDGEGVASYWKHVDWLYEDGALVEQPDANLTTVSVSREDAQLELTYGENLGNWWMVSFAAPESWELRTAEDAENPLFAVLDIYENGKKIGQIGYGEYTYYPEAEGESFYRSVYSGLMLGSMVTWDVDYTPIRESESGASATCLVARREGDAGSETQYCQGVLAYDLPLLRYIAVELTGSHADDAALAQSIAQSIQFYAVSTIVD